MPASRWQTSLQDILQWNDDDENELLSMIVPSMFSKTPKKENDSNESNPSQTSSATKYPEILPILPLRGVVVYPQTAVPLTVGQPRSIKLVDDVVGGDKLVGLVASTNPDMESPGPNDLYKVGT
ncbi:MAG TPA: LON peptidase substrate-binding domain-containing protein, partial [Anaerolineales bacterium]|nr:LON peptidase substrate-binding domain-containing protein [Anaerolineales bacterium]